MREGTIQLTSPATPSASLLVAMTRRCSQRAQERVHEAGAVLDQVLAVVQDQQHPPGAQEVHERLGEREIRLLAHA